jgi:hypothetical protein
MGEEVENPASVAISPPAVMSEVSFFSPFARWHGKPLIPNGRIERS